MNSGGAFLDVSSRHRAHAPHKRSAHWSYGDRVLEREPHRSPSSAWHVVLVRPVRSCFGLRLMPATRITFTLLPHPLLLIYLSSKYEMVSHQPLRNLWLTDLVSATSDIFTENKKLLMHAGARIYPNKVDAYDFESTLCKAAEIEERELPLFDLVFSHGFHFSTFNKPNEIAAHVDGQFQHLRSTRVPATCILSEAVHGQSAGSLFLGMHLFEFLNRTSTFPSSLNVASRCYLPKWMDSSTLSMKLRSSDHLRASPIWAMINGPLAADAVRYTIRTVHGEDQLDVLSMIFNTLRDGSHVIQLGCGELRCANALLTWLNQPLRSSCMSLPGLKGSHDLGSWRKMVPTPESIPAPSAGTDAVMTGDPGTPRCDVSEIRWSMQSYRNFVIVNTGGPPVEGTFGRVNLPRLAAWCSSVRMGYSPHPAPMIQRHPQGHSALFDRSFPNQDIVM